MQLTYELIFGILATIGVLFGLVGTSLAIYLLIEVKSLQRSTHTIQYMPVDEAIDKENQEYIKKSEWATTDESLDKQRKMFREDLDNVMPEFTEDEPEIISF